MSKLPLRNKLQEDYQELRQNKIIPWLVFVVFSIIIVLGIFGIVSKREELANSIGLIILPAFGIILSAPKIFPNLLKIFPSAFRRILLSWRDVLNIIILILLVVSLLLQFSFKLPSITPPSPTPTQAAIKKIIKIGVTIPETGDNRHDGKPMKYAIELAADKKKTIKDYEIEFVFLDDKSKESEGVKNVQQLIEDPQVAAIIGPFTSSIALKEIPLTNKDPIALISPSTTADCLTIEENAPEECKRSTLRPVNPEQVTFFRLSAPESIRGKRFAEYLYNTHSYRNVAIFRGVGSNSIFGDSFADNFSNAWKGQVLLDLPIEEQVYKLYERNKTALEKVDIIFFAGTGAKAIALYNSKQKLTPDKKIAFAGAGSLMNSGFVDEIKTEEPIFLASAVGDPIEKREKGIAFFARYKAQHDGPKLPHSAASYDAAGIIFDAIEEGVIKYWKWI